MKRGQFFSTTEQGSLLCELCPRFCVLKRGQRGFCGVRENHNGIGVSLGYGNLSAIHIDPMEKKPLYHFMPGTQVLSVGSFGCNLTCLQCQNHQISQSDGLKNQSILSPSELVSKLEPNMAGMAYTYNEPIIWYEFMMDCAQLVREKGFVNVMVSNGYINLDPLKETLSLIDAYSIDLKGFSEDFYNKVTGGHLEPVLESLKTIAKSDSHLEVDFLVIPGMNDDLKEFKAMLNWYVFNLGNHVPLHLNRYFPQYKMNTPTTSLDTLKSLFEMARGVLEHVHVGNVPPNFMSQLEGRS